MRLAQLFSPIAAIGLLMLTSVAHANDEALNQTSVSNGLSIVSLGSYRAREPKSLSDIPETARLRIRSHLVARLGENYFAQLSLVGGQIVDIDEMHRVAPETKGFRWKVFSYRLVFRLTAPRQGIGEYFAAVSFDKAGAVIDEIELPPVKRDPWKAKFYPLSGAFRVAGKRGFDLSQCHAEVGFDKDAEAIVYALSQRIADDGLAGIDNVIVINAHSGRVLRIHKSHWIR